MVLAMVSASNEFQSTPLREGRQHQYYRRVRISLFQSTPLREGRQNEIARTILTTKFQSTPLREGRLQSSGIRPVRASFNPRPYVRGDFHFLTLFTDFIQVSIHAPT